MLHSLGYFAQQRYGLRELQATTGGFLVRIRGCPGYDVAGSVGFRLGLCFGPHTSLIFLVNKRIVTSHAQIVTHRFWHANGEQHYSMIPYILRS